MHFRFGSWMRRDAKGNATLLFALTFMLVVSFIGGAIDFSAFILKKGTVQDALDEAALAAAISPSTDQTAMNAIAAKVFNNNIGVDNTNATLSSFKYDTTTRVVSATATGAYKTYILGLIGMSRMDYTVNSNTVRASDGTLEIALVLDNTWSMSAPLDGSQSKIQVLKTAAQALVSSVMIPANKDYVRVAVVPYADYVNVGTGNRSQGWLSVATDTSTTTTTTTPATHTPCYWVNTKTTTTCKGGTYSNTGCTKYTDGVPTVYGCWIVPQTCTSVTVSIPQYQVCPPDVPAKTTTTTTVSKWYGCVKNQIKSNALVMPDPATAYTGIMSSTQGCLTPIQPLTNNATTVANSINGLIVNIGTTYQPETYIPGGLIWGVNVLSPPAPFIEGAAYDTKNKTPRKTIVLMTDGSNTLYAASNGTVAKSTTAAQLATTYADQIKICNYAKAKNIEIYAIGFGVGDATSLANLKACATDAAHYFDAKSSADLIAAFQTIGGKLTKVRITG